jgi:hypothetical protein
MECDRAVSRVFCCNLVLLRSTELRTRNRVKSTMYIAGQRCSFKYLYYRPSDLSLFYAGCGRCFVCVCECDLRQEENSRTGKKCYLIFTNKGPIMPTLPIPALNTSISSIISRICSCCYKVSRSFISRLSISRRFDPNILHTSN